MISLKLLINLSALNHDTSMNPSKYFRSFVINTDRRTHCSRPLNLKSFDDLLACIHTFIE